ncbi:MAG: carbonic anhydrase [Acidimicrobiales bacterium]
MSNLNPLLERNEAFASTGAHQGLTPIPKQQLVVVTCMDGRVDPAHILGVELGDALVIRNSGGRVTDDVLNEIAFVGAATELMFGDDAQPFEVAIIHHTGCGSGLLADPDFRATLEARTGVDDESLAAAAVTEPFATVRRDVDLLTHAAMLPPKASVSGHVYDVDTGVVTTVEPAARPR